MKHALVVKNISIAYQQNQVVHDLNFSAPAGSLLAIVGPNGSGKTSLIKAIMGLLIPTKGEILIFNEPCATQRKKIAYIPQRSSVDWNFPATSLDIVLMGSYGKLSFGQRPGHQEKQCALHALAQVNMTDYTNTPISQLSGGQQQRLFIARALVQNAEIYLLDEPFVGVDIVTETIIFNLFKELQQQNKTIIVVHHDLLTVKRYFDTVLLMNKTAIACGPTATTMTSELITKAFTNYVETDQILTGPS